jgi:hypothetical protein
VQGRNGISAVRWAAASVVAVAALLILPAGALASAFYKGPVNGGANNAGVEFRAELRHHHVPRKVIEFRWFNVPVPPNCADSFEGLHFNMRVHHHRRFHGRYSVPNTNHVAIVHGKFKHHAKKAAGTIELKGSFAGGCSNADTGALPWTAKKAGT